VKARKMLALVMSIVMLLSLAACGGETTPETTQAPTNATEPPVVTEPVKAEVSVDFEDGNLGYVAVYDGMANADASTVEIVDYNGSKALKVTNGSGKVPYVAFDVWSLLGENAANVASVEMTMGIENPDGEFYACSGEVKLWEDKGLSKVAYGWSVYLENKNPKVASVVLKDQAFSAETAPLMVVTLSTDNGATAGKANANFFIDDIRFLDASGNLIAADTSVAFAAPNGFGGDKDMSNLSYLAAATVSLDGMSGITGGAWAQNGVDMTEDFLAAMVPGAVAEIEYASATGDIWVVMPDSAAGWKRINSENGATVNYNNSKNIAQITYEQFALVLGEDTSTWGARLQCEASGDWEVYSVKVGQNSGLVRTAGKTLVDGFACTGGGWAQNGFELTAEQWAMFQPGTILEVSYTSANGDLWALLPWSEAGWMRINGDNGVTPICDGATLQVPYEQFAAVCGEDVSKWGTMLQFEASGDWEVFAVSICTGSFVNTANNVAVEGFACTGGGWAQNGFELTAEQWAMFQPGTVLTVQYSSANGDLWALLPWSAAGWMRINADNGITPIYDGSTLQVTYEQMAAVCGEDVSTWGTMLQFEASGDWEVFSVSIGTAAE